MSLLTVFGGTGFLGRRVVSHLREAGNTVRIASRHPGPIEGDGVVRIVADVHAAHSVEAAVAGVDGVVNTVSLYVEHGIETFRSVHVEAAARVASAASQADVKRLVHLSGISAGATSTSAYIRSRGEGEAAVQAAFPGAVIIRPAVMFAPNDDFLTTILRLLRLLPAYPMFGDGRTKLQPVYAEDVAEAIVHVVRLSETPHPIYELAGPRVYTYTELLQTIAREAGLRPVMIRVPFVAWHVLASLAEILPRPPLTRNQVELMQVDTTASDQPGFRDLGISPRSLEDELRAILKPSPRLALHGRALTRSWLPITARLCQPELLGQWEAVSAINRTRLACTAIDLRKKSREVFGTSPRGTERRSLSLRGAAAVAGS
jgi:uncharacterized protein YbjT (DUF2867 family)